MRILAATLYSGENEFDQCVASIRRQTYRDFHHQVFSHLPKKRGHEVLFKMFMDPAGDFDLMVKVDADMVLAREDLFQAVVDKFTAHPELKLFDIKVHDFFSDLLIEGLNVYRKGIVWPGVDNLFTDFVPFESHEVLSDTGELAPAAYHCPDPSDLQSFHYGVHRALKVIQPLRKAKRRSSAEWHWQILEKVWQNFLRGKDRRVGLAALGAELTYSGRFRVEHADYSSPALGEALRRYASFDVKRLASEGKRLRTLNFAWLPSRSRRDALRYLRGGNLLDRTALRDMANSLPWRAAARRIVPRWIGR